MTMAIKPCFLKISVFLCMIFSSQVSFSQNQKKVDSLFFILKSPKNDSVKVKAYSSLSKSFRDYNIDTALYFANKGLKLAEGIHFKYGIAITSNDIAWLYYDKSDNIAAMSYFRKALYLLNKNGAKAEIIDCYEGIGNLYNVLGNKDSALMYNNIALSIC